MINQTEDGVVKQQGQPLSIGATSASNSEKPVLNLFRNIGDSTPDWTFKLNPRTDPADPESTRPGLSISVSGDESNSSRLFIDHETGNVGIGTSAPTSKLDVNGELKAKTATFESIGVTGNVGIGTNDPQAKLDIAAETRISLPHVDRPTGALLYVTGDTKPDLGHEFRHSNGSQGIGFGHDTIYATGSNTDQDLGLQARGTGSVIVKSKLDVNGNIKANNITEDSDLRYKENIASLSGALGTVLAMRGVRYEWKSEEFPEKQFGSRSQIGFIGQEVEVLCPEVVFTDSKGYKSLDYSRLTPILVEAIKEQQHLIEQQQATLDKLLAKTEHPETTMHTSRS